MADPNPIHAVRLSEGFESMSAAITIIVTPWLQPKVKTC